MSKKLSYKDAGVDISNADATKRAMKKSLTTKNPLVLNSLGAFASLVDGAFPGYKHPVLVCKTEEPGSKQFIAAEHGRMASVCEDMINHLINDICVMGATPLFIQDLIVCGKLEKNVVTTIVESIAKACKAQGCVLTGGETSEQPAVLKAGTYILGASGIGVVEKEQIIDGSAIKEGDTVLALASSGIHTNGYTLVRALMKQDPKIVKAKVGTISFLDAILTPHRCYYKTVKDLFSGHGLHGMAHITGGGIPGNLNRILPKGMDAVIDLQKIEILPVFKFLQERSNNSDTDMLRTFNLGIGLTIVVDPKHAAACKKHIESHGCHCYPIGTIKAKGSQKVRTEGKLQW